jgi:Acetyltransferase (GNAT) domain
MLFIPQHFPRLAVPSAALPVYMQGWFTDIGATSTETLKVTVVEGNEIAGSLEVSLCKNALGMNQAYNLPWARLGGPLISEGVGSARRAQIVQKLIDQLPKNVSYFLTLANEDDFKIFLASGFKADLEDNFVVPACQPTPVEIGFSKMTKRHLRKAEEELLVSTLDPEEFIQLYATHLSMRRRKPYAALSIAQEILVEAKRRGQASIMTAGRRGASESDAAIACLWDNTNYYYWMTTRRPPVTGQIRPHQGAVKLLLCKAIKDAHTKGLVFDCDGVPAGLPEKENGVTRLYHGLGATKSVRYKVKRETLVERLASLVRGPVKLAIRRTIGTVLTLKLNY